MPVGLRDVLSFALFIAIASSGGLPAPSRPEHLATRVLALVDPSRPDPVDSSARRAIMVQIWFPGATGSGIRAPYSPDPRLVDALVKDSYYGQPTANLEAWKTLKTHAVLNGSISRATKWPLLLFEPGLGMPRVNYTTYCEELASHGMVVAAIDPTQGGYTVLPDARVLQAGNDPAYNDLSKLDQKTAEWAADARFVLDYLLAHTGEYSVDAQKLGMLGHSMGGSAAFQAAMDDPRIVAAVDLDGTGGVVGFEKGARAPLLMIRSNPNYTDADLKRLGRTRAQWQEMGRRGPKMFPQLLPGVRSAPVYQIAIRDTGHLSYSDAPFLMPNTITRFSNHPLPARRTLQLTTELIRRFFDAAFSHRPFELDRSFTRSAPELTNSRIY